HPIHRHRGPLDRFLHGNLAEQLLLLAMGENVNVAVFVTEINLSIYPVRRAPDFRLEIVLPILLAGPGVEAVEIPVHLRNVDETVMDGTRAYGPAENPVAIGILLRRATVVPDQGGVFIIRSLRIEVVIQRRDVTGLGNV